jgi:hypothetical protein
MLVIMALLMRTVVASEHTRQAGVPDVYMQRTIGAAAIVPEWREQPVIRNEEIVPPPPGPYMSTALTPMPGVYEPDSGFEQNAGTEMANSPFFMPDMKWPDETRQPTRRWKPEKGQYLYVSDEVLEQQKQLKSGYSRNYPPALPRRTYARPVYRSRDIVERRSAYRGNSVSGSN